MRAFPVAVRKQELLVDHPKGRALAVDGRVRYSGWRDGPCHNGEAAIYAACQGSSGFWPPMLAAGVHGQLRASAAASSLYGSIVSLIHSADQSFRVG